MPKSGKRNGGKLKKFSTRNRTKISNQSADHVVAKHNHKSDDNEAAADVVMIDETGRPIRAPIAPKREVLVRDYGGAIFSPLFGSSSRSSTSSSYKEQQTVEGQTPPSSSLRSSRSSRSSSSSSAASSTLSSCDAFERLFRAPDDLLHRGTLGSARREAIQRNRWLLINVQRSSEFACAMVNRDYWRDHEVRTLIAERFLLWQADIERDTANSPDVTHYVTFYRVTRFPHIAVLDARTGETMATFVGGETGAQFARRLQKFLHENGSFGDGDRDGDHKLAISKSIPSGGAIEATRESRNSLLDRPEEEQIRAAIEASLRTTDSWTNYIISSDGKSQDEIIPILIRFPDGSRDSISLPAGAPLQAINLYVREKRGFRPGVDCELHRRYPSPAVNFTANFVDATAVTLADAGIRARDTLFVRYKMEN